MTKFFAGLQYPRFPRAVGYAMSAALVTTALFAADAAYRRYHEARLTIAASPAPKQTLPAAEPERVVDPVEKPATQASNAAPEEPGQLPEPALTGVRPADERPASGSTPSLASAPATNPAGNPVSPQISPQRKPTKASRQIEAPKQIKTQQVRRAPAKQAANDRSKPRRPVQAASQNISSPNVYFERDTQLGFAPQLRKRTCNAATGNMPMQCYYPRAGREKFPSKPLD